MTFVLGAIALILLLVLVMQLAKAAELASLLKKDDVDYREASNFHGYGMLIFLILFFIGMGWSCYELIPRMLPEAASEHGVKVDSMFNVTLLFTGIVFVITQILVFWFAFKYREKEGQRAYFFPHNNMLEIIWTLIPALVMTVLVVQGLKTWDEMFPDLTATTEDEKVMELEVVGKQFQWIVRYPGEDGVFGPRYFDKEHINDSTGNEMGIDWNDPASQDDIFEPNKIYLVKNVPVLVHLGALDVLHSFYLPHFRVKMDCVPGIPTQFYFKPTKTTAEMKEELRNEGGFWAEVDPLSNEPRWKSFKYELACAELCGKSHFGMQKEVVVVTQEQYDAWYAEQKPYVSIINGVEETEEEPVDIIPIDNPEDTMGVVEIDTTQVVINQ